MAKINRRGFFRRMFAGAAGAAAVGVASRAATAAELPPSAEPETVDFVPACVLPDQPTGLRWIEPVETIADLPAVASEGQSVFVCSEDRAYIACGKGWTLLCSFPNER